MNDKLFTNKVEFSYLYNSQIITNFLFLCK